MVEVHVGLALATAIAVFLVYSDLTSVRTVVRALGAGADGDIPSSLAAAHSRVAGKDSRAPALHVSPDPLPRAWIVRSTLGSGAIILSEGLLATLDESELRAVLKCARLRLRRPSMPLRTAYAAWAARLQLGLRSSPLTPLSAILGWMLFPLFLFLGRQSREIGLFDDVGTQLREPQMQQAWLSALTRVNQAQRLYGTTSTLYS